MSARAPDDTLFDAVARLVIAEARERTLPLTPETRLLDLPGWDSIKTIGLILAIEEHFGFTFSARDVDLVERVADFMRVVAAGTGQPGSLSRDAADRVPTVPGP